MKKLHPTNDTDSLERVRPLSVLSVTLELVRSRSRSALLSGNWELAAFWEEQALLAEERLWHRLFQPEPLTTIRPQRLHRKLTTPLHPEAAS